MYHSLLKETARRKAHAHYFANSAYNIIGLMKMDEEQNQELQRARVRFDHLTATLYAAMTAYHNEKERMAHNIILLEMALLGAVITAHRWLFLSNFHYSQVTIIIAIAACLLVHMHLRWQLRNRRLAAIQVAAIQNAMVKCVNTQPTLEEMAPPRLERISTPSSPYVPRSPGSYKGGAKGRFRCLVARLYPARNS